MGHTKKGSTDLGPRFVQKYTNRNYRTKVCPEIIILELFITYFRTY